MQLSFEIDSRELRAISPNVFHAHGWFSIPENSEDPHWTYYLDISEEDGKLWDWRNHAEDRNPPEEEEDDETEPVHFELHLQSRKFHGDHTNRYGMPACEESLWALLAELNQIGCDVVMDSLKEHLIKEKK